MTCPYLEYRRSDDTHEFDHDRPFCAIDESFVSPMKADICNDRHDFGHATHCEVFRRAAREGFADDPVGERRPGEDVITPEVTD